MVLPSVEVLDSSSLFPFPDTTSNHAYSLDSILLSFGILLLAVAYAGWGHHFFQTTTAACGQVSLPLILQFADPLSTPQPEWPFTVQYRSSAKRDF